VIPEIERENPAILERDWFTDIFFKQNRNPKDIYVKIRAVGKKSVH